MIIFLLCDCKNIWQVNDAVNAKSTGIVQIEIYPASSEMAFSWPKASKIGVVKKQIGTRNNVVTVNTIHDL